MPSPRAGAPASHSECRATIAFVGAATAHPGCNSESTGCHDYHTTDGRSTRISQRTVTTTTCKIYCFTQLHTTQWLSQHYDKTKKNTNKTNNAESEDTFRIHQVLLIAVFWSIGYFYLSIYWTWVEIPFLNRDILSIHSQSLAWHLNKEISYFSEPMAGHHAKRWFREWGRDFDTNCTDEQLVLLGHYTNKLRRIDKKQLKRQQVTTNVVEDICALIGQTYSSCA